MIKLKGIPVSPGIAIGKIVIKKEKIYKIERQNIHENYKESEVKLLKEALQNVIKEIEELVNEKDASSEDVEILRTHKLILEDQTLTKKIAELIVEESITKEHAVYLHFRTIIEHFEKMDDEIFSQRAMDYQDVAQRLLSNLLGEDKDFLYGVDKETILISPEISPSNVSALGRIPIKAYCTEKGSRTSHSSIIARALQIPAVVNVTDLVSQAQSASEAIVDGFKGLVYLDPDAETLKLYHHKIELEKKHQSDLQTIIHKKATTKDGATIALMSNMELPEELEEVKKIGSDGIGLFRSEFLYLESKDLPSEQKQMEVYKKLSKAVYPNDVIIRTIDIGGDKLSESLSIGGIQQETNPYLGCRGIRLSLKYPFVLRTQIQAILRANKLGNIKIMFPMISSVMEILKVKILIEESKKYLRKKKIKFNDKLKVGAMIEIPSAALTSDILAKECDFFSIGTNDLLQYTLAVDRNSDLIADYYDNYHPSIFQLIKMTVDNAKREGIPVAVCGEMASEPDFIPVFMGMGITELSLNPVSHLRVKEKILQYRIVDTRKLVEDIAKLDTSEEIKEKIRIWRMEHEN